MRKQTKILAVTALLALGASITSMAAVKGTWEMIDGEWYAYDKDGEVIENEFVYSNGKEFYVGDDGALVCSSWVEDGDDYFYVNSAGEKVTSEWRLLTPYEDEDEDEEWYWFKSNGERAEDTKLVIGGNTYFFDNEGIMLTGWIVANGDGYEEASSDTAAAYYCDENGARVSKDWIWTYAPGVDEDDLDDEDEENWYWIKSSGKPATGKTSSINGHTYFFDNTGKMLSGWISTVTYSDGTTEYVEIWEDDEDENDGYYDTKLSAMNAAVYFAREDGHMKKSAWINEYANTQFGADDSDNDKYWFYINSSGEVYVPHDASATNAWSVDFDDAEEEGSNGWDGMGERDLLGHNNGFKATLKKIDSKTYCFDENGQMMFDFVKMSDSDAVYYFGTSNDGARKDGSMTIADDNGETKRFYFATDDDEVDGYYNAQGISGAKSGKLYDKGMLVTATDEKYEEKTVTVKYVDSNGVEQTVDAKFIVNKSGTIQSQAKEYEEDDDVLINATNYTFYGDATGQNVDVLENAFSWQ